MKRDELMRMRQTGERKLAGESNLADMSEVRVKELEADGARYELDEKNRRVRKIAGGEIGPWEAVE